MKEVSEHKVAIRFNNVSFSFGGNNILNGISFHIHENEFVTLVGENGSGKTTLLKLILGLLTPDSGEIEVFGEKPSLRNTFSGYVPQFVEVERYFPIPAERVIEMGLLNGFSKLQKKHKTEFDELIKELGIDEFKKEIYGKLSGGQKRRVLIARALISKPRLLILDEPTANMDFETENRFFNLLKNLKGKTTILIVTHETSFVSALTDVVLCLGKNMDGKQGIKKHAFELLKDRKVDIYSGDMVRVLHDTSLPDDFNCCNIRK